MTVDAVSHHQCPYKSPDYYSEERLADGQSPYQHHRYKYRYQHPRSQSPPQRRRGSIDRNDPGPTERGSTSNGGPLGYSPPGYGPPQLNFNGHQLPACIEDEELIKEYVLSDVSRSASQPAGQDADGPEDLVFGEVHPLFQMYSELSKVANPPYLLSRAFEASLKKPLRIGLLLWML
ncbi:hypothetical protein FOYG_07996 [Fusarium oxysporum NRRL 32931]|uniref:Uncharacterized protein n=1 Tax=Fusarium oxysporum NRRL 32931 TaxID=660029 RepID=W9IDD0_FUSOX|nr:hypothetical protein FOYG_07996 [Fusarium oxysporum NRRL 32931]